MKKAILLQITIFICIGSYAQLNDWNLTHMLIGQNVESLDSILNSTGYDYTITYQKHYDEVSGQYDIYIDNQWGGIKLWELGSTTPFIYDEHELTGRSIIPGEKEYITTIFIRYRHSNTGDLKDFKSYELIENDSIRYEKKMGKQLSHLKIEYVKS